MISRLLMLALVVVVAVTASLHAQRGGRAQDPAAQAGRAGRQGQDAGAQGDRAGRGNRAQQPATGTAAIRGRVIASDTGQPVRRAQVRAQSNSARGGRLATTDGDGRFELPDLPAGRWTVSASKGGFITQQYGQRRAFETVPPIELAEGQRFTADFFLSRGGVITGRVFDEFGDPITGARVQVLRARVVQGQRRLTAVGAQSQSDDTGAFRVFGLAPGDYYVGASLRAAAVDSPDDDVTYAPTYYPGTPALVEAQRVSVGPGEEQSGINFTLMPVRAVRVSGSVTDSTGAPLQAVVTLTSAAPGADGGPVIEAAARNAAQGQFTLVNVVPGAYVLNVAGRRGATAEPEVALVPITVGNDDLTGLTVVTSRGATVKGTIVAEGVTPLAMNGLRVQPQPLSPRPGVAAAARQGANGQVSTPGTFELGGLIGPTGLRLDGLPAAWMVKSMSANGVDIASSVMDFRPGDAVQVRIVVTDRVTSVTGTARLRGQPATGGTVIVFPEDEAKWTFPTRYVRSAAVTPQGAFTIRALPPGERYLAAAVDYIEEGEATDPEFLARLKERGTAFRLADGETRTVDLTVSER